MRERERCKLQKKARNVKRKDLDFGLANGDGTAGRGRRSWTNGRGLELVGQPGPVWRQRERWLRREAAQSTCRCAWAGSMGSTDAAFISDSGSGGGEATTDPAGMHLVNIST